MKKMMIFFGCFWPLVFWAQTSNLEQQVTFEYINMPLEEVLADVSVNYRVYFSYSRDFISLDQDVRWKANNASLEDALSDLFDDLDINYKSIGNQMMLKPRSKTKEVLLPQNNQKQKEQNEDLSYQSEVYKKIEIPDELVLQTYKIEKVEPPYTDYPTVAQQGSINPSYEEYELTSLNDTRLAQVSLFPSVGTNQEMSEDITNNVSLNVFWGRNGGVNGVEVGGFVNTVEEDVRGVQIAGLANIVNGDVGTSDWIDEDDDFKTGVQVAGLFNKARNVRAVQVAGLINLTQEDFSGVEIAGIGNYVGADAKGFQISGLYNINEGNAGSQVTGLINIAEDVEGFQISGLFNKGKHVKKFQLGLINVSDSIQGNTYGLINWVKGGTNRYNHFEISGSELLHIGMTYKMGVPAFYNMFHVGMHLGSGINGWGLGYGIGTLKRWNSKVDTNLELSVYHINEGELWTNEMNMLYNLKMLFSRRLGRHQSFFFGPTLNVMFSKVYNPERNTLGSQIVPYTLFKTRISETGGAQILTWVGFNVGFRF